EQQQVCHFIQHHHPAGRHSSADHDVCVPVEELDELLQTPEAALQAAHEETGTGILRRWGRESKHTHYQDQSTKCQGAHMVPDDEKYMKNAICPVVGGKGSGQRALSQGDDKIGTPEERHHIVDLQVEEVPLKQALVVVFDEYAAGLRGKVEREAIRR
uniref:Uncharacterized protein n=1 Tax=Myripristis murdjan TaxID=586833 RepID=A0A667X6L7_9TELE